MNFLQESIEHEICKMDILEPISGHSWQNIYHTKLKLDLRRVDRLVSMWPKAHNDLRDRNSHRRCSVRKAVLKNFAKLQKNTCTKDSGTDVSL